MYEGRICDARFSKSCGGITETFENCWAPTPHPYLSKVIDNVDEPIGYDFFVSTENKSDIEPDENLVAVVEKIAPVLKLNTPVVIDMLTKGYYTIKIQKQVQSEEESTIEREIYRKIVSIDVMGKVDMISPTEFEYRGDMTWHQLVDKMIRMGFEQNPEFDKISGSNSYESKEEESSNQEDKTAE